jgi:hypothetical protein
MLKKVDEILSSIRSANSVPPSPPHPIPSSALNVPPAAGTLEPHRKRKKASESVSQDQERIHPELALLLDKLGPREPKKRKQQGHKEKDTEPAEWVRARNLALSVQNKPISQSTLLCRRIFPSIARVHGPSWFAFENCFRIRMEISAVEGSTRTSFNSARSSTATPPSPCRTRRPQDSAVSILRGSP